MGTVCSGLVPGPGLAGRVCELGSGARRHGASGLWARAQGTQITCREGELDLLLDHLEGHEVMLLVEAPVVQQQAVTLLGGKPVGGVGNGGREWGTHWDASTPAIQLAPDPTQYHPQGWHLGQSQGPEG